MRLICARADIFRRRDKLHSIKIQRPGYWVTSKSSNHVIQLRNLATFVFILIAGDFNGKSS